MSGGIGTASAALESFKRKQPKVSWQAKEVVIISGKAARARRARRRRVKERGIN